MTYLYGHHSEDIRKLQQALIDHGFSVGPDGADGKFWNDTRDGVMAAQEALGISPPDGVVRGDLLALLGLSAPPKPKPIRKPGLFELLASIKTIIDISKGKTMSSDQITGAVRAVLGILLTWLVAKGIIPAGSADTIVTAVIGVVLAGWSIWNNRPSNSAPK